MDGGIEVASEKGEGSTFRFRIKVGLPSALSEDQITPSEARRASSPTNANRALDVLIVEGRSTLLHLRIVRLSIHADRLVLGFDHPSLRQHPEPTRYVVQPFLFLVRP
jgi:hypothetical protein